MHKKQRRKERQNEGIEAGYKETRIERKKEIYKTLGNKVKDRSKGRRRGN